MSRSEQRITELLRDLERYQDLAESTSIYTLQSDKTHAKLAIVQITNAIVAILCNGGRFNAK